MADRHAANGTREQIGCAQTHRQTSRPHARSSFSEIGPRRIRSCEAGIGEGQRQLRQHECDSGSGEGADAKVGQLYGGGPQNERSVPGKSDGKNRDEHEDECYDAAIHEPTCQEHDNGSSSKPPNGQCMIREGSRGLGGQFPGKLAEQEPHGQLHSPDDRARENLGDPVEQARKPEHNENSTHEQGPGRDLVGTKTLCDGDGPECLQRLYRHRQPVKQSCSHIEQSGRQKNGGCGQAVLDDERHRDGDEHPQIRDRTGKLGPIEPQSLRV